MKSGAIYVGNAAYIEFERTSETTNAQFLRENMNTTTNRWSFDFADSVLQTGDRIRISRMDKTESGGYKNLVLVDGSTGNNVEAFCYVDMIGRIRLYRTFADSMDASKGGSAGDGDGALSLTKGTTSEWERNDDGDYYQNIKLEVIEQGYRPFAKCSEYTITTNRDTIDVTTLGEYFYKQWENGLIQGQGTVTAMWDTLVLEDNGCGDPYANTSGDELAAYFAKLILRIQIGAGFRGRFYLKQADPDREPEGDQYAVYWQADCVCTNVAIEARPDQIIQSRIEFVTTGLFQLEIGDTRSEIALAAGGAMLEREGDAGLILTN